MDNNETQIFTRYLIETCDIPRSPERFQHRAEESFRHLVPNEQAKWSINNEMIFSVDFERSHTRNYSASFFIYLPRDTTIRKGRTFKKNPPSVTGDMHLTKRYVTTMGLNALLLKSTTNDTINWWSSKHKKLKDIDLYKVFLIYFYHKTPDIVRLLSKNTAMNVEFDNYNYLHLYAYFTDEQLIDWQDLVVRYKLQNMNFGA